MQKTSYQCQQFAFEIERVTGAPFADCLAVARKAFDPNRKPINGRGAHSQTRNQFILALMSAHVRHDATRTNYDLSYRNGLSKQEARTAIRDSMGEIIHNWTPATY